MRVNRLGLKRNRMCDNKLLAEYLGYSLIRIGYWGYHEDDPDNESQDQRDLGEELLDKLGIENVGYYLLRLSDSNWMEFIDFKPDKNWNQLMMVVEKIRDEINNHFALEISVRKNGYWSSVYETNMRSSIQKGETMIEAVYNACVEHVKTKTNPRKK